MVQAIEAIQIPPDDGDAREELLNKVEMETQEKSFLIKSKTSGTKSTKGRGGP